MKKMKMMTKLRTLAIAQLRIMTTDTGITIHIIASLTVRFVRTKKTFSTAATNKVTWRTSNPKATLTSPMRGNRLN